MAQHPNYQIRFRIKGYQFSARYSLTLLMIFVQALFLALGFWQVSRGKEKTSLLASYQARMNAPPMAFDALPKNTDIRFYRIQIKGKYDNKHVIFLDNKIYQHRVGYEVITPFVLKSGMTVLVNRGWVPALQNRGELPFIPEEKGEPVLTGMLYVPTGKPFTLGQSIERVHWPLRIQYVDIPALEKILQKSLYPNPILLMDEDPYSGQRFVRDWQPVNMPAYKHWGYAAQWFTFALVLIIIFVILSIKKIR